VTWVKLDDRWPSHRKVRSVDPLDRLMWLSAIAYCSEQNTDGILDQPMLDYTAFLAGQADAASAAARLVRAGLLDQLDGGTWRVHDYLDYQPSAAHRVELSNIKADAGRKGGRPPTGKQTESTVLSTCLADEKQTKSRPRPRPMTPPSSSSTGASQADRDSAPPPDGPTTDDDERINQALHRLGEIDQAAAIAAGVPIRNPPQHLAACVARRQPDRPAIAKLAGEHPDWPAEQLADRHLNPPPPPRLCNNCRQPDHPNGLAGCPELAHLRTPAPPPADLRAGLTKASPG